MPEALSFCFEIIVSGTDMEGADLCHALIEGEAVVVPDLDALEELIARYWLRAA